MQMMFSKYMTGALPFCSALLVGCSSSIFENKSEIEAPPVKVEKSEPLDIKQSQSWLDRTDIAVNLQDAQDSSWSVETLQPLHQTKDTLRHTVFYQGRVAGRGGDETVNLGLGYRKLNPDETAILGANIFYDTTIEAKHQRFGLGFEYIGKLATFRSNIYRKLSGEKTIVDGSTTTYEQALNGIDYSIDLPVPSLNPLRFNLTGYNWKAVRTADDLTGRKIAISGRFNKRIRYRFGVDDNNYDGTKFFASLTYKLGSSSIVDVDAVGINEPSTERNLRNHTLDKVVRENDVIVQKRGGVVIGRSSS